MRGNGDVSLVAVVFLPGMGVSAVIDGGILKVTVPFVEGDVRLSEITSAGSAMTSPLEGNGAAEGISKAGDSPIRNPEK